jgi:hypothetical protein
MDYANRTYHEIFRGSRSDLADGKQFQAGYALRFDGTVYYVMKLWFQQERSYFIKKNDGNSDCYSVFGKKEVQPDKSVRLLNPLGHARMTEDKEYLEIILPDLPRRYYMTLFSKAQKLGA